MAQITHKLEILVNAGEPVSEIKNVINGFLQLHPGRESEILSELKAEIDAALAVFNVDETGAAE
ncbi:hypothetical protein ACFOQM_23200 [Paenibacillus sp. GCM10012307]|uniref:Uncharacterized protein n=1 Tax=Paenibacillus roseus TaxID=2798579 RepID=A0A934MSP0_9BACL|nr:hypothetical protein [Paenibacillus roseus]MBJ6364133.1 hypothetical protein [Paenibacillus roseus]